jgi:hypothetical protein
MLQLLDPPLGLREGGGLLADDLVAEIQVVGQGRGGLAHAKIVGAHTDSKRAFIAGFRRFLGSSAAAV